MSTTPTKKAATAKKAAAKKAAATSSSSAPADATAAPAKRGVGVGQLVKHTFDDIPSGTEVTVHGIVAEITDDGALVVPLGAGAVVPVDQLQAL
jgi:hypothetical protein